MNDTANTLPASDVDSPLHISNLSRAYFPPNAAGDAQTAVEAARNICAANNIPLAYTWKAESEPLPPGYGVGILPVTQRSPKQGEGNIVVGCYIAGIPDPDTILDNERGGAWARAVMEGALLARVASAVRPRDKDSGPLSIPFSVEDFITSSRGDAGTAWFREHVGAYCKTLNELFKRKIMNPTLLRQVLASAAFAHHQFQTIGQDKWTMILDMMIAHAARDGADPGIVKVWRETRDTTDLSIADFGLDALTAALGKVATTEGAPAPAAE